METITKSRWLNAVPVNENPQKIIEVCVRPQYRIPQNIQPGEDAEEECLPACFYIPPNYCLNEKSDSEGGSYQFTLDPLYSFCLEEFGSSACDPTSLVKKFCYSKPTFAKELGDRGLVMRLVHEPRHVAGGFK